jgi:hypothetical protein
VKKLNHEKMKTISNTFIPELILNKDSKNKVSNKILYRTIQRYNIPTSEQYNNLIKLIYLINRELLDSKLPEVMLSFSRGAGKCGKIKNDSWQKDNHKCYEIILNPDITGKNHKELLISLVHTLGHFQQKLNDTSTRDSYHNTDFSERMRQIGLLTRSNENNKDKWNTGQNIDITVIKDGKFEKLLLQLKDENFLPWKSIAESLDTNYKVSKNNNKNKIPYICNKCNAKVWGKPGLNNNCNNCNNTFKEIIK